jgi:hypothetical protein
VIELHSSDCELPARRRDAVNAVRQSDPMEMGWFLDGSDVFALYQAKDLCDELGR